MGKARPRVVTKKSNAPPRSVVLDAGALIAFERGDARMRALLRAALETGARLVIPAGVLAQVWRRPATQVALGALSRGATTLVVPLDQALAEAVGALCGKRKTSDVVDASVVLTARREGSAIVTSDPDDLRHLDGRVELHRV
jgi:predicted nucleic acid-binding protein